MLIRILILILSSFIACRGQSTSVVVNLSINYRPVYVELIGDSTKEESIEIRESMKLRYRTATAGLYKIVTYGTGIQREIKESVVLSSGQKLVLNVQLSGKCLYDLADGVVPKCPANHTDQIIPITYGLIGFVNAEAEKQIDSTFHLGGCVVTDCDPQYYCKIHKVEF